MIAAVDEFFATFQEVNFNGTVFVIKLIDAIQAVTGVTRVVLNDVKARDAATAFSSATTIDPQGFYATAAGYIISEDDAGNTLEESISMEAETN